MADNALHLRRLELARRLVGCLEADAANDGSALIAELADIRETALYADVGRLTRELHDALNRFLTENCIANHANRNMPDARGRLHHVIQITEQSAHQTLGAVEDSLALSESIGTDNRAFWERWHGVLNRQPVMEWSNTWETEIQSLIEATDQKARRLQENLSTVMMAQTTQDLAGQVIRQVIALVQGVEGSLVDLLRVTGQDGAVADQNPVADDNHRGHGPSVPGIDDRDVARTQDDVDDLLLSLGF